MENKMLNAALEYASRGWSVIPISRTKTPLIKWKEEDGATAEILQNADNIRSWWEKYPSANVAIITGKRSGGLTVIDVDIDHDSGKYGDESLDEWCEQTGCYIDSSMMVRTGRGGKHLYFTSTESFGNLVGCLENVDIRGEGGLVVAPPSIHGGTRKTYEWEDCDSDGDVPCVQEDSDVEYFLHEMFKSTTSGEKKKFEIPDEAPKGSRNDMIFKIASSLQAQGASDDVILATCRGYNESKCNPPLGDEEIQRTVESALRYEKGSSKNKETISQETQKSEELKNKTYRKLKKAKDLMGKELPEPKVIVGVGEEIPLIVEGTCILSAKPKLGKSWFALAMCLAVSNGDDFLGYKTNKCSTLYLDLETSEQLQQKRMKKALNGKPVPENFYLETETDNLDNGFINQIESYLKEDPDIGLVVIDVFQVIRSKAANSKEDEYSHTYRDITPLNQLAQEHHISIMLVCHDRKAVDSDDPFSNILGSIGLQGAATQMMVMFRKTKELPIHISVKGKTIDGLPELDVRLDNAEWTVVTTDNVKEVEKEKRRAEYNNSDIRQAILEILKNSNEYKGSCSGIIDEAIRNGVKIEAEALDVGKFLSRYKDLLFDYDNIKMNRIKNGTGAYKYILSKTTVDTVDGAWATVDGNTDIPFE